MIWDKDKMAERFCKTNMYFTATVICNWQVVYLEERLSNLIHFTKSCFIAFWVNLVGKNSFQCNLIFEPLDTCCLQYSNMHCISTDWPCTFFNTQGVIFTVLLTFIMQWNNSIQYIDSIELCDWLNKF